ncbi:MAG: serpin family protein [Brevefilum sp.]|nr:serpin family protein [Brevefilum sp.]
MNKRFSLLLLITILLTTGCTAVDLSDGEAPVNNNNYAKSSLNREVDPDISLEKIQSLAQDNTRFALSFYGRIRDEKDNIIFSPISLSLALSMTLAGAESGTEQGMIEALQLSLPENEIYPSFNALLLEIEKSQNKTLEGSDGNQFQLNIANSLWGQAGYKFESDFLDTLAKNYGAGMNIVDYKTNPEESREIINQWVEKETEQKIQDLIPPGAIDPLTRLILANAIYFKGSWLLPFRENGTEKAPFYTLDGSEMEVDMMQLFGENLRYYRGENFQAFDLPYLSKDFSMRVILPDKENFLDFEEELNAKILMDIDDNMRSQRVNLRMPKFDYESTVNANEPLIALGMSDAFDPSTADFSGINQANELFITDVLHKATITVDEEGTEAAAATAVIMGLKSMAPEDPVELTVDRPFLYFIQHHPTGTILFFGRVVQP